jgi:hypothetical protein
MRKPSGKIKINRAGEIPMPKYSLLNGCPKSEDPSMHDVERQGE